MADPITTGADWRTSAVQPSAAPARMPVWIAQPDR